MAVREELVVSAAQFLQDPSVAASSLQNRVAFLRTKHLNQDEIDAALARAGQHPSQHASHSQPPLPPPPPPPQSQAYNSQYAHYGWQAPPSRRDWRDWFIMATVVSGVGYGLYALGKRYVYPLIAPPTPERLEQDKKAIDDQFEKAFVLFEQLSKDTEALKAAEQDRSQRLDSALADLEIMINELKSANNRREDEAHRVRTDVQTLKEAIPKGLNAQKELTDGRLRELTTELASLKTLMSQRATAPVAPATTIVATSAPTNVSPASSPLNSETLRQMRNSIAHPGMFPPRASTAASESGIEDNAPPIIGFGGLSRASTFSSSMPGPKASIPSWQLAMATKSASSSPAVNGAEAAVTSTQSVTGAP